MATPTPVPARGRWRALPRRHPSAFLLLVQLLNLAIFPLLGPEGSGRVIFGAFSAMVVVLAVWVVQRTPATNWFAWLVAAPAFALSLMSVLLQSDGILLWSSAFEALLYFYAAGSLIAYMLSDHVVTRDELFAAGATFTLFAWGFAYAYVLCQALDPGSFAGSVAPERPRTWLELLFMSFSVMSGVGIGDVVPIRPPARVLVMLEMVVGVGYLATVVARLIGLTIIRARS